MMSFQLRGLVSSQDSSYVGDVRMDTITDTMRGTPGLCIFGNTYI